MQTEIGLAIRLSRVAVGLSQYQLAARAGLHPCTVNAIERGRLDPSSEISKALIKELAACAPNSRLARTMLAEAKDIIEKASDG